MTFEELRQVVVASANAKPMVLDDSFERVRLWVETTEVVYAVWQDAAEPDGVGMLLIKGERALREIAGNDRPASINIIGILSVGAEQAEALRQAAGDRRKVALDDGWKLAAAWLDDLARNLSPFGLQMAAINLLSHIAQRAEAAPDPVHGGEVIDHIAMTAKQSYRKEVST